MTPRIFLFAALAGLLPAAAFAQSCAAPIELPAATTTLTGNTCTGSVELPNLIDGAILNENQQHVYHVKLTGPNVAEQCNDGEIVRLQPDVRLVLNMLADMKLPPLESFGAHGARDFLAVFNAARPAGRWHHRR